jgi:Kef-type K+ transport system membrane component KefB
MHVNVLTVMGFTVIIAVLGHMLFDRIGIPESIFMIIFGLILGPISGIININDISSIISNTWGNLKWDISSSHSILYITNETKLGR